MTPSSIFQISDEQEFNALALDLFHEQSQACEPYARFLKHLDRPLPLHYTDIPCLPISTFKSHDVYIGSSPPETIFTSSGTTGSIPSRHLVKDLSLYKRSFLTHFEMRYGKVGGWCILALLPSYLEREGSSLVYMANSLIQEGHHADSGFYLDDYERLAQTLIRQKNSAQKTLLIGVSFALLDFVAEINIDFPELIVMETGGMKGRRKELVRQDLHEILKKGFAVPSIHSEYGMTELLSQAYASQDGLFHHPPWMRVIIREVNDPFTVLGAGYTGGLNIIDLANRHSCAFIASDDLGRLHTENRFEVLGRFDHSDMRGCSLMV